MPNPPKVFDLTFTTNPEAGTSTMKIIYTNPEVVTQPVVFEWMKVATLEDQYISTRTYSLPVTEDLTEDLEPVISEVILAIPLNISGFRQLGFPTRSEVVPRPAELSYLLTIDCFMTFGPTVVPADDLTPAQYDQILEFLKNISNA